MLVIPEAAECKPLSSPNLAAACQHPHTYPTSNNLHAPVSSCVKEKNCILVVADAVTCAELSEMRWGTMLLCPGTWKHSLDVCSGALFGAVNLGPGH